MSSEVDNNRLIKARKLDGEIVWAWETWADSFDDLQEFVENEYWKELEFSSALDYVQQQLMPMVDRAKLSADFRRPIVKLLKEAGFSNRAIGSATGTPESTIRNDVKYLERQSSDIDDPSGAQGCAPNEVDAAGQSVEEVGHIDDDEPQPRIVIMREATRDDEAQQTWESIEEEKKQLDRFAGINFDGMVIKNPSQQIIETEPSKDSQDYFTPRPVAPSWSPPLVRELPSPKPASYDAPYDDSPEFLGPPMKVQKAGEANKKPDDKHCRTCACNLLP